MADNIGIRPRARSDVVELATYIGKENASAANRFLDSCEATFQFLAESLQSGGIYQTKNNRFVELRVIRIKGFPNHLTFYLERANGIEIVRVLHGARDLDVLLQDE